MPCSHARIVVRARDQIVAAQKKDKEEGGSLLAGAAKSEAIVDISRLCVGEESAEQCTAWLVRRGVTHCVSMGCWCSTEGASDHPNVRVVWVRDLWGDLYGVYRETQKARGRGRGRAREGATLSIQCAAVLAQEERGFSQWTAALQEIGGLAFRSDFEGM